MVLSYVRRVAPLAALTLVAAACGGGAPAGSGGAAEPSVVRIDGSSTVFPISEAVAEEFQKATPGTRVTVGISGTGGGFQKFCRAETDISDASRPIRPTEIEACAQAKVTYIELPIAYDGIVLVANPKADWISDVTTEELKKLWEPAAQGQVMRWSQVRAGWPDREIHLFGAGVDSGTYDYFTEALVGKEGASRGDFTSSEDDNVLVQGIANDELAFGFMPYSYFDENRSRLKAVPVNDGNEDNGAGAVMPEFESIRTGTYQPLSRPVFIYINADAVSRPEIQAFVDFYLNEGPALVKEVGEVPLSQEGYDLVKQHFAARRTGTVFGSGGSQVGVTIEELLSKERTQYRRP
ncbi:MAG: PstS family phosphate ABC transporter substrate-binding protein [Vicinamibacterales bacterium]